MKLTVNKTTRKQVNIFSLVRGLHDEYYPNRSFIEPSDERIIDILYDFKYGDISREGMIAFVETFADIYGVGIEKIIGKKKHKHN